jgi:hypothetical protein
LGLPLADIIGGLSLVWVSLLFVTQCRMHGCMCVRRWAYGQFGVGDYLGCSIPVFLKQNHIFYDEMEGSSVQ